jgi:hypothetical protein
MGDHRRSIANLPGSHKRPRDIRHTTSCATATSQKSRCTPNPTALAADLTSSSSDCVNHRRSGGLTTTADTCGGVLGLREHVLCVVEVLGPAAGDQRAGPAGAREGVHALDSPSRDDAVAESLGKRDARDLLAPCGEHLSHHRRREQAVLNHADRVRESLCELLGIVELTDVVSDHTAVGAARDLS